MGDIEWYDKVLNFVPSDGREHWAGGVKVAPSEHFTERQDALFAAFIDEFTLSGGPSMAIDDREYPLVAQRNGSPWYITMISSSTQYTDRLYECNPAGSDCLNRDKDPVRTADVGRTLRYGARFVVSDWWVWSCDCSTQVYIDDAVRGFTQLWYDKFGNDACFSFDMYMGFWNGKINERRWISIDNTTSRGGWQQIHFNGDTPVNRKYSAAPPDPVRIRQKDASGTWRTRLEFSTGLGQDGISTGNVGGNGTYKPFESTCDIKLLLPIVQG